MKKFRDEKFKWVKIICLSCMQTSHLKIMYDVFIKIFCNEYKYTLKKTIQNKKTNLNQILFFKVIGDEGTEKNKNGRTLETEDTMTSVDGIYLKYTTVTKNLHYKKGQAKIMWEKSN